MLDRLLGLFRETFDRTLEPITAGSLAFEQARTRGHERSVECRQESPLARLPHRRPPHQGPRFVPRQVDDRPGEWAKIRAVGRGRGGHGDQHGPPTELFEVEILLDERLNGRAEAHSARHAPGP